ncbi:MAG: CGNR zinc finger domain-containing protein [Planctomycetota bacterium]|jgi:predicted RNA-binding Zn ribbon-like protein
MGYNWNMTHHAEDAATELFELSGGVLCLDFANTWGNHADSGSDRLTEYEHLVAFARQTGRLMEDAAAVLSRTAAADAVSAASALSLGRTLRRVIYRIMSSRAGRRDVAPEDVEQINGVLGEALSHRRLERRDGAVVWSWTDDVGDLRAPIWPVVESAAALLTSDEIDRVHECDAEDCNWLFLDCSRSGTRRWCSMSSCGNRAKARRHYLRRRKD